MEGIFSALPQLAGLIEKAGVVGVMLIVAGVLAYEIKRGRRQMHDLRGELGMVYAERDLALMYVVKLQTMCEENDLKVDLSGVKALLERKSPLTAQPFAG